MLVATSTATLSVRSDVLRFEAMWEQALSFDEEGERKLVVPYIGGCMHVGWALDDWCDEFVDQDLKKGRDHFRRSGPGSKMWRSATAFTGSGFIVEEYNFATRAVNLLFSGLLYDMPPFGVALRRPEGGLDDGWSFGGWDVNGRIHPLNIWGIRVPWSPRDPRPAISCVRHNEFSVAARIVFRPRQALENRPARAHLVLSDPIAVDLTISFEPESGCEDVRLIHFFAAERGSWR